MKITETCKEYCIGCGLCHSELKTGMDEDALGFFAPQFGEDSRTEEFLKQVCPVTGLHSDEASEADIWGSRRNTYAGFSTDSGIRKKASSGGVITTLAIYLLESGQVDAVIEVAGCQEEPYRTEGRICRTAEEVIACCGSRYSISAPWMNLRELTEEKLRYAAVGKPCDIAALRNLKNTGEYGNILYLLSFFCAGMPSDRAGRTLLEKMNCNPEQCVSLNYRGNGWPGMVTAVDKSGHTYQMEYSNAWGGILGRDIHPFCRVCFDGIGLAADVACGDGWYLSDRGEVDFSERDGRNVIFPRTETGEEILQAAAEAGRICLEPWEDISQLKVIQNYQYMRRATMRTRLLAYRLFGKRTPHYPGNRLKQLSGLVSFRQKLRIFLGTVKRIMQGRI